MNRAVESELLAGWSQLEPVVAMLANAKSQPSLFPLFARMDELAQLLPRAADPVLRHYQHQQSYEKARLQLPGRAAEHQAGNCRPR